MLRHYRRILEMFSDSFLNRNRLFVIGEHIVFIVVLVAPEVIIVFLCLLLRDMRVLLNTIHEIVFVKLIINSVQVVSESVGSLHFPRYWSVCQ